jgi:cobalt-zinc-cadmium efflux system protein
VPPPPARRTVEGDANTGHPSGPEDEFVHDHAPVSAGARHAGRLTLAAILVAAMLVAELVVALATGSLALLSDAGHLATDLAGLLMALAAIRIAAADGRAAALSYGWHRLEILAALANSVLLLGIAGYVAVEGIQRLGRPPELAGGPLVIVAVVGLVVNLVTAVLLRDGAEESLNLQGARLEVLADAVGSVAVLVAGLVIATTGWTPIDAVVALGVAAWVLPRALRLGYRALRVLVQAAPEGLDLPAVSGELRGLAGVADVHDLHAWTLTSGLDVASVHVRLAPGADAHDVLHAVEGTLTSEHGMSRTTVQLEPATHGCGPERDQPC